MGTGLGVVLHRAFSYVAAGFVISYRILLYGHLAAVAAEKFLRTYPEAIVFVPSVATPLPVFVGFQVFFVRQAAAAIKTAFGE